MSDEKDPLPNAFDAVTFVGDSGEEAKPASVAAMHVQQAEAAAEAAPVKVKVKAPFRVVHDATPHVGGDVVEVPRGLAAAWIRKHWAEPVPTCAERQGVMDMTVCCRDSAPAEC